ncbi:MotE family protein [Rubeoparvulum massiliense]|uniref:MotE family protein n=1 Tax=Rubeoparvulum massiliense TaxID=1631346 RepID=UPI00065E98FB|nr:hypothetical protein [Rubeoparvulum massiliense]
MEDVMGHEEKKYRWWEWIFYIIILPLLFTSILVGTLMTVMGYDVLNGVMTTLNRVPIVEKVIPDPQVKLEPEEERRANNMEALKSEILRLEETRSNSEKQVKAYEQELQSKDLEIARLQEELKKVQAEIVSQQVAVEQQAQDLKEIADIFRSMSASKAAKIIDQLTTVEAGLVLEGLKPEEKGPILAKMSPEKAASLTMLLTEGELSEDQKTAAYQQEIARLKEELKNKEGSK